jgi:hypothetical protein
MAVGQTPVQQIHDCQVQQVSFHVEG